MENFTQKQIAKISELTPRQVQFYTERGVVIPEVDKGVGRGNARRYSLKNLWEFLIVKKMVDQGITIKKIKSEIEFYQKKVEDAKQGRTN